METKKCSKCKKYITVDNYTKNKTKKDGLNHSCKECHRQYTRKHYENNKQYYVDKGGNHGDKLKKISDELKSVPCLDCGKKYPPYVMDYDHRDPAKKSFPLSNVIQGGLVSLNRFYEEVAKCDVVCANCHRERTWGPKIHLR